jgi:hypothetical protein
MHIEVIFPKIKLKFIRSMKEESDFNGNCKNLNA